MEQMTKGNATRTRLIRRFVAIALTLLSVGALFWPSAIAVGGTLRVELRDQIETIEEKWEDVREGEYYVPDYYDSSKEGSFLANSMNELIVGTLRSFENPSDPDTTEIVRDLQEIYGSLFGGLVPAGIRQKFLETLYNAIRDLGISFNESREIVSGLPYFVDKARENGVLEADDDGVFMLIRLCVIGYNVLFFLVIALAAAAIVMMVLNRSKVFSILHAILSVLYGGAFIALWVLALLNGSSMLLPGVGAFLLPILAIAACIVYKRDRSYTGAFPKRERKARGEKPEPAHKKEEKPAERVDPFMKEANAPAAPNPAADGWLCPVCNGMNDASAKYCTFCGTVRPEPEPEEDEPLFSEPEPEEPEPKTLRCPSCGAEMELGMRFCTKCGTKLR